MSIFNNGNRIEKHVEPKGNNSPFVTVRTSSGTVRRPNPNYDPKKCPICGGKKGAFHKCK